MEKKLLMNKALKYILLTAAGTLLLAGCQKTGIFGSANGEAVRFTASASSAATKTAYGDFENSDAPTWQRIDWEAGDEIRIWSDVAKDRYTGKDNADYKINTFTANGRRSIATIVNSGTYPGGGASVPNPQEVDNVNGLVWEADGPYAFYGIYPVTGITGTLANNQMTFSGLAIPAPQDGDATKVKDYGYLTAALTGVSKGADVPLEFDPAFTAFEINLKAAADAGEIKILDFELASTAEALAGPFTVSYAGATKTFDCTAATDKTITVNFGEAGQTISATQELNFTIFALPQDFSNLTLRFNINDGTSEYFRALPLKYAKDAEEGSGKTYKKGEPVPFAGCKKHRLVGLAMTKYQWVFEAVELGLMWDVDTETMGYNTDPVVNAGALYIISGAASGSDEKAASFAGPNPIEEYFTVFAPSGGQWVITNSNANVVTLSAQGATPSTDEESGVQTLIGTINGRVDLSIAKGSSTGTAVLNFYVEVGGRRYSINSEVPRNSGGQVITNN